MARTKVNLADQVEDVLSPSNIAQDGSNRFVTDAEKTGWNAKASTAQATTGADSRTSSAAHAGRPLPPANPLTSP